MKLLRLPFLLIFFLLISSSLFAQNTSLSLGTHIGMTSTTLVSPATSLDIRQGTGAFFGIRAKLENRFFIRTGLDYYGTNIQFEQPNKDKLFFTHYDIPLYIGYNFWYSKDRQTYFRGSAGGAISLFNEVRNNDLSIRGVDFNQTTGFLKFGLGMNHQFITFDFYYDLGLKNLLTGIEGRASRFSFTAGVQFVVIKELF